MDDKPIKLEYGTPKEKPAAELEDVTIADMNGDYSVMRPSNQEIPRLHVVYKDGHVESFMYMHMGVRHSFHGDHFVILFEGAKHWEVKVYGRKLWRIYNYIALKRWPYLREALRDMDQDGEIITHIKATDVTPREG